MPKNQRNKTAKIALMDYICTNAHSLISFWLPCAAAANLCVILLLTNTGWIHGYHRCENVWFLSAKSRMIERFLLTHTAMWRYCCIGDNSIDSIRKQRWFISNEWKSIVLSSAKDAHGVHYTGCCCCKNQ